MRSPKILALVAAAAAIATLANACGGKASSSSAGDGPGGGPLSDAAAADASLGKRPAGCPDADPQDSTPCSTEGVLCEYGDDFNPLCNVTRVCSGGSWAEPVHTGVPGGAKCPSTQPTIAPNPADCPADANSLPPGLCSSQSTCSYDGAICGCGIVCPTVPISRPPCDPDAGLTTNCCDTSKIVWHCFEGPKYCTSPRPRIGAPCSTDAQPCAVDPPAECGQAVMECQMGVWNLQNNGCASSGAGP